MMLPETLVIEDFAVGTVEFENGLLLQITSSRVVATEQAVNIKVYADYGTAIYTYSPKPHVTFIGAELKIEKMPQ